MTKRATLAALCGVFFAVIITVICSQQHASTAEAASSYRLPPTGQDQWYWMIGGGKLPPATGSYPAPGSANIWDTDDFGDANGIGSNDEPNGPSSIVSSLHASGKYSICYIEAGAQQAEPDASHFAAADYGNSAQQYEMQGWAGEYWFDTRGFAAYKYGDSDSVLTGSAANIAAGMAQRIAGCAAEGQDAIEPDDLDGYTNPGDTGVAGGGWGLTKQDAQGYEAWLAYTAHTDGLAIFQKNDTDNISVDEPIFDGAISEECNAYNDPCSEWNPYLNAGKPVLNAEYTDDGETTAKFCSSDEKLGIAGALFNVDLDGTTYQPCEPVGITSSTSSPTTTTPTTPNPTTAPAPLTPFNTKRPALRGRARQGHQLKTRNGTWTNATRYAYTWKKCKHRCRIVKGATHQTYNLGSGAVGYRFKAVVTATNRAGSASATSAESSVVRKKRGLQSRRCRRVTSSCRIRRSTVRNLT
jgi:Glycoside-hydrolase family GH114